MKRPWVTCAVVVLLTLSACGGSDGSTSVRDRPRETTTTTPAKNSATADDYVGLTKTAAIAKAESAGVPWRITREDSEHFLVTQDYNPQRVNFEIDKGRVTSATFG